MEKSPADGDTAPSEPPEKVEPRQELLEEVLRDSLEGEKPGRWISPPQPLHALVAARRRKLN